MGDRIELEHLVKIYPGASAALADVSIIVEAGTFLVLLGPSGSGKTTMLRCLAGIERITSGTIRVGDNLVAGERLHLPPEQRNLSMVFQDYALWPHLVVRDNVAFAMRRRGVSRDEGRRHALAMLDRVGLSALSGRFPSQLSGGEQQRVALARALVADTGLILCDEPLSNLDADLRERMRIEISGLVREAGATAVYITHDQSEAFALADLVGVLEHGRLVQLSVPEEVYLRPVSPFVARFTGLAGEMAVRIGRAVGDGLVETAPSCEHCRPIVANIGGRASLPGPATDHSGPGLLTVRTAATRLCGPGNPECHLIGEVADVAFRGRGYEHAVVLPDGSQLTGVFAGWRVPRGERVGLHLETSGCLVFPGETPGAGGTGAHHARNAPEQHGLGELGPAAPEATTHGAQELTGSGRLIYDGLSPGARRDA